MKKTTYTKFIRVVIGPRGFSHFRLGNNWEGRWVYHPQVVQFGTGYFLFYSGKTGYKMRHDIGMAKSTDFKIWKRYTKNPILSPSKQRLLWDSDLVAHGFIFKKNGVYYMFYDGSPKSMWKEGIGVATSLDLYTWKKYKKNPVLTPGDFWWDKDHVSRCCVVKSTNSYYYMYYAGHDHRTERIGVARSKDLFLWEKFVKEPVLHLGKKDEWDERHISDPRVLKVEKFYLMLYTGYDKKARGSIGIAYSTDLISWKKFLDNPLIPFGKQGSWNQDESGRADFVKLNNKYYIFFSGRRGKKFSIGYCQLELKKLVKAIEKDLYAKKH